MTSGLLSLAVSDVKQYFYCSRIVFYRYCMPLIRPVTPKMEIGKAQHGRVDALEKRRSIDHYEAPANAERRFHVRLTSERLGLSGIIDLVIVSGDEAVPVDFKNTWRLPGANHKHQLCAYALLLREEGFRVSRAVVHLIPARRDYPVMLGDEQFRAVRAALEDMRDFVSRERVPPPTRFRGRCVDCEYLRFCGDIEV